jgi:hypothetical protein
MKRYLIIVTALLVLCVPACADEQAEAAARRIINKVCQDNPTDCMTNEQLKAYLARPEVKNYYEELARSVDEHAKVEWFRNAEAYSHRPCSWFESITSCTRPDYGWKKELEDLKANGERMPWE